MDDTQHHNQSIAMTNATDPKDFSTRAIHAAYDHHAHLGAS